MTAKQSNPFVLPGLGQGPDLAGNPLMASLEMMRQAWAGMAGGGGLSQLPMAPPLNLEDLERRIAELHTVENWLKMNLSMLSSTIQGLEVQRATIATLRSFVGTVAELAPHAGDASPLEVALGLRPAAAPAGDGEADDPMQSPPLVDPAPQGPGGPAGEAAESSGPGAQAPAGASPAGASPAGHAGMSGMGAAAQSASQAWWNLLQQQFDQIASATAASMTGAAPGGPGAGPGASRAAAPASGKGAAKAGAAAGGRAAPRKRAKPAPSPAAAASSPSAASAKPARARRPAKAPSSAGPASS